MPSLADTKITKELLMDYRNTFTPDYGQRVFADLLWRLGYYRDDVETPGETELRNFASSLIKILAGMQPYGGFMTAHAILESVCSLPIPETPEELHECVFGVILPRFRV